MNGGKVPKRLDASKLTQLETRTSLSDRMNNLTFDGTLEVFKDQVNQVGAETRVLSRNIIRTGLMDNEDNIKWLLKIKQSLYLSPLSSSKGNRPKAVKLLKNTKQSFSVIPGK